MLIWAELYHNFQISFSPFEVCYSFQPLMFEREEQVVDVPSAHQRANERYITENR